MGIKISAGAAVATALDLILHGLEHELMEASDSEVIDAAHALGMNPRMRGSAAFAGLKYSGKPQMSDFFDQDDDAGTDTGALPTEAEVPAPEVGAALIESQIQFEPIASPPERKKSDGSDRR